MFFSPGRKKTLWPGGRKKTNGLRPALNVLSGLRKIIGPGPFVFFARAKKHNSGRKNTTGLRPASDVLSGLRTVPNFGSFRGSFLGSILGSFWVHFGGPF